jgi:hypothetical protein
MQIAIFAILPELDGMPPIWLLETREADTGDVVLLGGKKAFEGLREPIRKHLYRCGRDMFALPLEYCFKLILAGECLFFLILCLDDLKHAIINGARLGETIHEQSGLLFIRIQAVFKGSHVNILLEAIRIVKRGRYALRRRPFTPIVEARGPQAAYG